MKNTDQLSPLRAQITLLGERLSRLNRRHMTADAIVILVSLYLSLYLRVNPDEFKGFLPTLNRLVIVFVALRLLTFTLMGVYYTIWRYISVADSINLAKAVFFSSSLIIASTYLIDIGRLPRATFFIDTVLLTLLLTGMRLARRVIHESSLAKDNRAFARPTLIYGAGILGRTLAQRLTGEHKHDTILVGFIDDNPEKVGRTIGGTTVLGTRRELPRILRDYEVQDVIVAISSLPSGVLAEIVQTCRTVGIRPRILGSISSLSSNNKSVELFRNVELSDLLNRPKREVPTANIASFIRNRRVLVTGAGGSIGSELARQIQKFGPSLLLLLDHSEYHLYQIDQELRVAPMESSLVVPVLADIKDKAVLKNVFEQYSPDIVFHAAAYKHVHLVEGNPYSAILNNIAGTKNLLELSEAHGVQAFTLISTDKAVNPAGVMGATKRICELMVNATGQRTNLRYCAVRFGNVLGSSGSLIPLLKEQLKAGEPLTITHKDMTRYFMLIPEAVSLVLRAATIASPGDIAILKMGEPIRIVDIARALIVLSGKTEEQNPIVFTGLRPGEKLFEELYFSGDELNTEDPDVLVLPRSADAPEQIMDDVDAIITLARQGNRQVLPALNRIVKSEYFTQGKFANLPTDKNFTKTPNPLSLN